MPRCPDTLPTARRRQLLLALGAGSLGLGGCFTGVPAGIVPVQGFDLPRYLGRWYEIARLDHGFERGLSEVTADYRLLPDGSVEVVNRGYDAAAARWKQATGRAVFIGDAGTGSLKVSFFGPFYGGYHIAALDAGYQWSVVVGPTRGYCWLLARQPVLAPELRERLTRQIAALSIGVDQLIWVPHGALPAA